MKITTERVKELRDQSGAGIMECRNALVEANDDMDKAVALLKERCLVKAEKKKGRAASQGLIEVYIHTGGRIAAMVELNCESDFVARTDEFKALAHSLAMQVAAMAPHYTSKEEVTEGATGVEPERDCLLLQPFIKDPTVTIQDVINQTIGKLGENIKVSRFTRFEVGDW